MECTHHPELRVKAAETRYRIPDVVLVDHGRPIEQVLTYPPLAVFEVLSPEDSITRILTKLEDYERMGIRSIFVIQPKSGAVYRFRQGGLEQLAPDVSNIAPGPCFIDWRTVAGYLT